jgi:hypothetical protein
VASIIAGNIVAIISTNLLERVILFILSYVLSITSLYLDRSIPP